MSRRQKMLARDTRPQAKKGKPVKAGKTLDVSITEKTLEAMRNPIKVPEAPSPFEGMIEIINPTLRFAPSGSEILPPLSHEASIEEIAQRLRHIRISLSSMSVAADTSIFAHPPRTAMATALANVVPRADTPAYVMRSTRDTVRLMGLSIHAESASRLVAAARRALLQLCEHEIDEALFAAGLQPDPHRVEIPSIVFNAPQQPRAIFIEPEPPPMPTPKAYPYEITFEKLTAT